MIHQSSLLTCALPDLATHLGNIDALICCSSFESRSLSIAQALTTVMPRLTYIGQYNHRPAATEAHFLNLKQLCGPDSNSISLHLSDPIRSADAIFSTLESIKESGCKSLAIDVSTFTHETVLVLYRLVPLVLGTAVRVFYLYTGASEYSHQPMKILAVLE